MRNSFLLNSTRFNFRSIRARVNRFLRFGLDTISGGWRNTPAMPSVAMLELLPNRLLFSTTPPTFYVHSYLSDPSNPNSYTTVPATFLTDSNGDYIKDPNPAPVNSDGQPVQLYSSNGTVYPNPNGYLAVPAGPIAGYPNGFSIDAAIANAQTYQTDLASFTISGTTYTVGFNNLGQIARDFGDNGSQDLQREGGVFYPAFQSAANFNL